MTFGPGRNVKFYRRNLTIFIHYEKNHLNQAFKTFISAHTMLFNNFLTYEMNFELKF